MIALPPRDKRLLALLIALLLLAGAFFQYFHAAQSLWRNSAIHRFGPKATHREMVTLTESPVKFRKAVNSAWLRGTGLLILSLGGFYYFRRFSRQAKSPDAP